MGQDYKCSCRASGDAWYLCPKHEGLILDDVEEDLGGEE